MRRSLLSFHPQEQAIAMDRCVAIDDNTFYHCMFDMNTLGSLETLLASMWAHLLCKSPEGRFAMDRIE